MKIVLMAMMVSVSAFAKNLHLIDEAANGFAIYRYGESSWVEEKQMKDLGISEVMILSGDADEKGKEKDFGFKIVYNETQSPDVAVTKSFLVFFDQWVAGAKAQGKKIAFRCECGCHRTGRLAAYYQMKYQRLTPADAIAIMNKYGSLMFIHKNLIPQVYAYDDLIKGRACGQEEKWCVK